MIQNSLDRIFGGLVAALLEEVAPRVSDPYAHAQVLAAADLLANLATRVRWDPDYLAGWIPSARAILRDVLEEAGAERLPEVERVLSEEDADEPESRAAAHLAALAEAEAFIATRAHVKGSLQQRLHDLAETLLEDDLNRLRRVQHQS